MIFEKERRAAAVLLGADDDTDGLTFLWTQALWGQYDVVQITDVDEGEVLGFVVFGTDAKVITAFTPPEK